MSDKFTTKITDGGVTLVNTALASQKTVSFGKAVASQTAFTTDQLTSITDTNYANASKNQDGSITAIQSSGDNTINFEIFFDGRKVSYDYTLNTVFLLTDDGHVFAVIKANQPQYMNAYSAGSSTDLQINVGIKVSNSSAISLTVDQAGVSTQADLDKLETKLQKSISDVSVGYKSADTQLQTSIDDVQSNTNAQLNGFMEAIQNQSVQTSQQLETFQEETIPQAIKAESDARAESEDAIKTSIAKVQKGYQDADSALTTQMNTSLSGYDKKLQDVIDNAKKLQDAIDSLKTSSADASAVSDIKRQISDLTSYHFANSKSISKNADDISTIQSSLYDYSQDISKNKNNIQLHWDAIQNNKNNLLKQVYGQNLDLYSMHWDTQHHKVFYGIYEANGFYFMKVQGELYALHDMGAQWDMDIAPLPSNTDHLAEWMHTPAMNVDSHWVGTFAFHDGNPRLNTFGHDVKANTTIRIDQWIML